MVGLYQAIERRADWPKQTLSARTAWLDKTEGALPSLNPLDYRGLAILSKVYRLYFAIRLKDLKPWIQGCKCEEQIAGTEAATGAEDAWYSAALDLELAKVLGQEFTGGSADIWKCFDQIQRELIHFLLELSGSPIEILKAYKNFHENVEYHNTIGTGLGAPYSKQCSIPQCCPISMTLIAFLSILGLD